MIRLELPLIEHGFSGLSQELSGSAQDLPPLPRRRAPRGWRCKPSDDLATPLDVHGLAALLDAADQRKTVRAELRDRNAHSINLHGHSTPGEEARLGAGPGDDCLRSR